ncbi:hypothetical protein ACEE54_11550, partial [Staphylococcus hyicus]
LGFWAASVFYKEQDCILPIAAVLITLGCLDVFVFVFRNEESIHPHDAFANLKYRKYKKG